MHDKMVLLTKTKLNSKEDLTSKVLIDLYVSHDKFTLVFNVLKEFDDIKVKSKILIWLKYLKKY